MKLFNREPVVCVYGPPPAFYHERKRKFDTIIFDLGGVLMNLNIKRCIASFEALMGEETTRHILGMDTDGEGVAETLMQKYEAGLVTTDEFIGEILKYCKEGTTPQQVTEAWISMHDGIPQERIGYLRKLHDEGYRICLLSNNNDIHWNDVCEKYDIGDCFDHVFLSHILHCSKPDEKIFRHVCSVVNSNPRHTVYIDDLEANRKAASRIAGWRTCADIEQLKDLLEDK